MPGAAIRTSFIVGFPGETEEEFRALLDFVEETGFEHMGAFIYSKEEGTAAAALKGHLPATVKKRRYEELMKAQAAISLEKNIAFVGRTFRVLVDEVDAGVAIGRLPSQSPDVDGVVIVEPAVGLKKGKFVNVLIKEAYDYDLKGVVVGR
jgi:ribosomal protein S12 methylthiotransferase